MASPPRIPFVRLLVVVLCLAVSATACAQSVPSTDSPREVAKLPHQGGAAASAKPAAEMPATPSDEDVRTTSPQGPQLALLVDPVPPADSAASLVERAHEYGFYWDHAEKQRCLEQAAYSHAGTPDAGRALVILARTYYETGDVVAGDSVLARARAECSDAEIQAFADVARAYCLAVRAGNFEGAESILENAAEAWRGAELGGWAALQLGNLHRDYMLDFDRAIPRYASAAEAYPNSLVAEEAEVSIGECLAWSMVRHQEAAEDFKQVLGTVTSTRLRIRAWTGIGFSLMWAGEYAESCDVLSDLIEGMPDHPGVSLARAYRSYAASRLGLWELAVEDAAAFIASPAGQSGHPWVHHTQTVLGQDAFRQGMLDEAEAHFQAALVAAPDAEAKATSVAGVAHCRAARGDLGGALEGFLAAADVSRVPAEQCAYLHQAALMALAMGDSATADTIAARMAEEHPGSHLTTRLLGYGVLPAPEI